jgi:hypothetical protein
MTAVIRIHNLRANRIDFLELVPGDLPAIYGARLETLLRGRAVICGKLMHKLWEIKE